MKNTFSTYTLMEPFFSLRQMCGAARAASQSHPAEVGLCVSDLGSHGNPGIAFPPRPPPPYTLICQIKDPAPATEGCFVAAALVVFCRVHVKREIGRDFRSRCSHRRRKMINPSHLGRVFLSFCFLKGRAARAFDALQSSVRNNEAFGKVFK